MLLTLARWFRACLTKSGTIICALALLSVPSWAAIANVGSCSATATSCTLSATGTGDLNVFWAYRSGSTTAPALPAGNTNIGTFATSAGGTTGVGRLYCRLASSGADTGSGTATNATAVAGLSYSGVSAPSNLSASCAGMGVAQGTTANAKASTTATFGSFTILNSSDWVAAFLGDSAGSSCTPTTLSSRSTTGDVHAFDTNGTVSSWGGDSCTVSSSTWISATFALLAPPALAIGSNPQLKRSYGIFSEWNGVAGNTTTSFQQFMDGSGEPRAAVSGDLVVIGVYFPSTVTLTISDSTGGSNTWTQDATNTDAGTSTIFRLYHSVLSATTTSITFTTSVAINSFRAGTFVFYNVAASPVDGTAICASAIVPTQNFGSTIQTGNITTTVDGDLIFQIVFDEGGGGGGLTNPTSLIAPGDNQQLLSADRFLGSGAQYFVQTTHGAVNPGMSIIQVPSPATFATSATCAVAFKPGASGTAPGAGASVIHQQLLFPGGTAGPILAQLPSSGNFIGIIVDINTFTGVPTDNHANTYVAISNATGTDAQIEYSCNATTANNLVFSQPFTSGGGNTLWVLYDVAGIATSSCLDTAATVPGGGDTSVLTNPSSGASRNGASQSGTTSTGSGVGGAPTLIPSAGNTDFFLMAGSNGLGPTIGLSPIVFSYINGTNTIGDGNTVNNGDHAGYYRSASSVSVTITFGASNVNSWSGVMAGFKQAPATGGQEWQNNSGSAMSLSQYAWQIITIAFGLNLAVLLIGLQGKVRDRAVREVTKLKEFAFLKLKDVELRRNQSQLNAFLKKDEEKIKVPKCRSS
jgi:hypothetical protein